MPLLALALLAAPLAHADVALAPEQTCYGDIQGPSPTDGAVDVPLDVVPRFVVYGAQCGGEFSVVLTDGEDAPVEVALDFVPAREHTVFEVVPAAALEPDTAYTLTITSVWATGVTIGFTTGQGLAAAPGAPEITDHWSQGFCQGRGDRSHDLRVELDPGEAEGHIGYLALDPEDEPTWQPIFAADGYAMTQLTLWNPEADRVCAQVALLGADGALGEWEEVCFDLEDLGACRNGLGAGCSALPGPAPIGLVALLPLFAARRRRSAA
jgi:hypothetical protein